MSLALGLVGLPNAGKSTLFNAMLARAAGGPRAAVASYPFTTIDPNLGQVSVPDDRLAAIAAVTHAQRIVPATIQFIDIAGLVRGASKGEGLGNRFLAHIRDVDAIVHVVRAFASADVAHVEGVADPVRDADIVETELALADLETVEHAIERLESRVKAQEAGVREQVGTLRRVAEELAKGVPARRQRADDAGRAVFRDLRLLTDRPVIYVGNVDETSLPDGGPQVAALRALADRQGATCIVLAARLEAELGDLPAEEAKGYLASVGLDEPVLPRLIRASYRLLGLISFFTVLSNEVRAWPVPAGTTAVAAAGRIHTDMARGFIRAEVIGWEALVAAGNLHAARERGTMRLEGRDYGVADGDVMTFRFSS